MTKLLVFKQRFVLFSISILASLVFLTKNVQAQTTIPTIGKDFWLGFLNNYNGNGSNRNLQLFISSPNATSGTVSVPLQGWSAAFTIVPNVTTTISVPNNIAEHFTNDVVDTRGVHVVTLDTVSLFAINFASYTSDAAKILPIESIGTDYIVSAYGGISAAGGLKSEFLIVATKDATQIEIVPSVNTQGGHAAGVPYIINLNEGESYQVYSQSATADLTGTRIKATAQSGDCRPFAVFGGSQCTNIPAGCTACDHIFDQLYPANLWGVEYYTIPFSGTTRYTYKVLARDNGTAITINGGAPIPLNAGQVYELNNTPLASRILSNNPVAVIQYMQGTTCSGSGDPAMLVLNAEDQRINSVTFSTVTSTVINQHNLNLIVETLDVGTVLLDNVAIPPASYTLFPGVPTKSYAQLTITQGSHYLFAPNGFTAYVYGTGSAESYAYSVGAFQYGPPIVIDSVLCSSDTMVLAPIQNLFSPVWTTLSDTSTIIGTGNSLVLTPPIINDVYIITGNSLLSGCSQEFLFSVSVPDPPIFSIATSNDTVCRFNNVQMNISLVSQGNYEYSWTPSYLFDNPTSISPVMTAEQSGWVYVTVSSIGGACASATDSVYIEVLGGGISSLTVSSDIVKICLPDTAQLSFEVEKIRAFEDFDGGINSLIWASTNGAITSNLCGAINGDALYFNGIGSRIAETNDFDVSLGGNVNFYIKIANGVAPCDDNEFGDDVLFEYSINGGLTWVVISTLFEFAYPNLTYLSVPIPVGAQTTSTRFRWRQPVFDGADLDIWILDNVTISAIDNSNLNYSWSPGATLSATNIINPIAFPNLPEWYVVNIDDAGCIYSDSVFIDVDPGFVLTTSNDTALCTVQEITLSTVPSQGTGHSYVWTPSTFVTNMSGGNLSVMPTAPITYYVTVTSPQGCIRNDSVSVYSSGVQITLTADTMICIGDLDTLLATFNVPSTNYTYQWLDPNGQVLGNSLEVITTPSLSGNYVFTSLDTVSMCPSSESIYINAGVLFPVTSTTDSTYCGTQNMQLSAIPGIPGDYSYVWNASPDLVSLTDSVTSATISVSNSYIVTITSISGCTVVDTISIGIVGDPGVDIFGDTIICVGNSLTLSSMVISGISDSFDDPVWNTSLWSTVSGGALNTNCGSISGNALHFNGSPRRAETIDLNTSAGGFVNFSIVFGSAGAPCENADNGEDVVLEYSINGGLNWVQMGYYDEAFYTVFTAVSVPIPVAAQTTATRFRWRQITFSGVGNDNWALDNVSVDISSQGNYVYEWYDSANQLVNQGSVFTFMPDSSGLYSVVASDTNSACQLFNDQYIEVIDLRVNAGSDTVVCSTFGYQLQGSYIANNPIISWQNAAFLNSGAIINPIIQFDTTSLYVLTVSEGSCIMRDTVLISNVYLSPIDIPNDTTICNGDMFTLDLTGANSITWTPLTGITNSTSVNPIFNPTVITNYIVDYVDGNGCANVDSINVMIIELPQVTLPLDTILCQESTYLVQSVSNVIGPDYYWSTNETSPDITISAPGIYWLEISTSCGIDRDSIVIDNYLPIIIDLGNDTTLCEGDALFLVPNIPVGGSLAWNNASTNDSLAITIPSLVWVNVQDINGCQVTDSIEVDFFQVVSFDLGVDISFCTGDEIVVGDNITPMASYLWNTNESTALISISNAGLYSVEAIDTNGCLVFDNINLIELPLPNPIIIGPSSFCDYDVVNFSENGNFPQYLWHNDSTTNYITHSGSLNEIWVQVTDLNNCIGYDTLTLNVVNVPSLDLGDDIVLCDSSWVNLDATIPGADTYLWNTLDSTSSIEVGVGSYIVEVGYDICEIVDAINVSRNEVSFDMGSDYSICLEDNIILTYPLTEIDSIIWSDGTNSDMYIYDSIFHLYDTIVLSATAYGCGSVTDTIAISIEDCNCQVFVPNTFTPNGDQYNNVFKVHNSCDLEDFNFLIFNRWGEIIFKSNSTNFEWDGTSKSTGYVQDGVYIWKMTYYVVNSLEQVFYQSKMGHVNVLK